MTSEDEDVAGKLLTSCSVLVSTQEGPQGTAFFVAPGHAITAAHVAGAEGAAVRLDEGSRIWHGHVIAVCPPRAGAAVGTTYPAPDVALIRIDDGPEHACAFAGRASSRHPELGNDARLYPDLRCWGGNCRD